MQSTRKRIEGTNQPDRNEQFNHINNRARLVLQMDNPVISVDTKKKENVGLFSSSGKEWRPRGQPIPVLTHDFPSQRDGKAIPYGVYNMGKNKGFVNVGCDHDTSEFAVASIRAWWRLIGQKAYRSAERIYFTADASGSNGYRCKSWNTIFKYWRTRLA